MKQQYRRWMSRFLALTMALVMTLGTAGESLTAAAVELEAEEVIAAAEEQVEQVEEVVLEEEAVEEPSAEEEEEAAEEETLWEAPVEAVEEAAPAEETQPEKAAEKKAPTGGTITGFVIPEDALELYCDAADRPTEKQLTKKMPKTISVYLGESEEPAEIAVSWYCVGGGFADATEYYYQFSPKWDTKQFKLAKDLDVELDAPEVGVFFSEGTGITTQTVTKSGNELKTYRFLIEKMGLNCAAALGIMANIQSESGFSPSAVNKGSPSFHGICQWGLGGSTGSRWSKLKSWCKKHGYSASSLNGQLRYMKYELENVKSYHYSTLKKVSNSASGASSAAKTFAKYFEGCSSKYFGARQRLAKGKYWNEYSPLAKAKITVHDADEIMYDGGAQFPQITLSRGSKELVEGKDYKVSFSDNVNVGTANIVITGKGNYCGVLLGTFVIHTGAPKLVSAVPVSTGVKVTWEPVDGAVKYRLYRKDGGSWKKVKDTASLSCVDTGAKSGENNVYTVRCISADGAVVSGCQESGVHAYYIAAPALTLAAKNNGLKVSWSAVNGASQYLIQRKNADGTWENVKTTTSTSWTDTSAAPGKSCTYRAVSLDTEGDELSMKGAAVSVKLLAAPALTSAKGVTKGIKVTWKKVTGAAKYRVYRLTDGKWKKVADTTSTSWKDKSVKKNKKYTYTVCCLSKDGKTVLSGYNTTGVSGKRKK